MIQRKRPRPAPLLSDTCDSGHSSPAVNACHEDTKPQTLSSGCAQSRHRRRRRDSRRRATLSWRLTMATLLLCLCDNRNSFYHSRQSLVDAWGGVSGGNATVHKTKKGLQVVGSCSREAFQIKAVYLLCDSPGAYYRGSSTYRDSTTCVYGDKARLQLKCKSRNWQYHAMPSNSLCTSSQLQSHSLIPQS